MHAFLRKWTMKKNDVWEGTAESYTYNGEGVVRSDEFVYFVPGMIEGETAKLGVTALKKNYGYARIAEMIMPSCHRTVPGCSVYKQCGGCQLLHMDTEEQLRFKTEKVKGVFRQNADMEIEPEPVMSSSHVTGYRNKVQVPVQIENGRVKMGFYRNRTNDIVEFDNCLVQTELSNKLVRFIRKKLQDLRCGSVFRHVLIKHAHRTGMVMVCLVVREYPFRNAERFISELTEAFPEIHSLTCIVNRREDNVILDGKETVLYGLPYIEEELLDCRFRISARSFYQINPYTTELLYRKAIEYAGLTGKETVIDLYCGTGTIGILCAKHAKKVYGIEIVADAVKDAEVNASINNVTNIRFFADDARHGAKRLIENRIRADVVIVDPPRKGCSKETLDAILSISPERLVYVSCDPSTLARDCAYLVKNGYQLNEVTPADMFPGTIHVETVCLLTHKD